MDNTMSEFSKKREGFLGQKIIVVPENIQRSVEKNPLINSLYLTSIGYYPFAENHFRARRKGADQYILIYCLEGSGNIEINNQKFQLLPNHFLLIPPSIPHRYGANEKDPWSIYWLHFVGSRSEYLYKQFLNIKGEPGAVHVPFQKFRIDLFKHIMYILEKGYSKQNIEYVNITLWELLSSFIYSRFFQEIGQQVAEADFINEAINYMQECIDQSISVEELARHVNYSTSYFHSSFKDKTGFSPVHYFNQLKIQKACQYLSFTNYSVKEISHNLGFNDPFYFSRLFKKLMNLSPSKYRKIYKS